MEYRSEKLEREKNNLLKKQVGSRKKAIDNVSKELRDLQPTIQYFVSVSKFKFGELIRAIFQASVNEKMHQRKNKNPNTDFFNKLRTVIIELVKPDPPILSPRTVGTVFKALQEHVFEDKEFCVQHSIHVQFSKILHENLFSRHCYISVLTDKRFNRYLRFLFKFLEEDRNSNTLIFATTLHSLVTKFPRMNEFLVKYSIFYKFDSYFEKYFKTKLPAIVGRDFEYVFASYVHLLSSCGMNFVHSAHEIFNNHQFIPRLWNRVHPRRSSGGLENRSIIDIRRELCEYYLLMHRLVYDPLGIPYEKKNTKVESGVTISVYPHMEDTYETLKKSIFGELKDNMNTASPTVVIMGNSMLSEDVEHDSNLYLLMADLVYFHEVIRRTKEKKNSDDDNELVETPVSRPKKKRRVLDIQEWIVSCLQNSYVMDKRSCLKWLRIVYYVLRRCPSDGQFRMKSIPETVLRIMRDYDCAPGISSELQSLGLLVLIESINHQDGTTKNPECAPRSQTAKENVVKFRENVIKTVLKVFSASHQGSLFSANVLSQASRAFRHLLHSQAQSVLTPSLTGTDFAVVMKSAVFGPNSNNLTTASENLLLLNELLVSFPEMFQVRKNYLGFVLQGLFVEEKSCVFGSQQVRDIDLNLISTVLFNLMKETNGSDYIPSDEKYYVEDKLRKKLTTGDFQTLKRLSDPFLFSRKSKTEISSPTNVHVDDDRIREEDNLLFLDEKFVETIVPTIMDLTQDVIKNFGLKREELSTNNNNNSKILNSGQPKKDLFRYTCFLINFLTISSMDINSSSLSSTNDKLQYHLNMEWHEKFTEDLEKLFDFIVETLSNETRNVHWNNLYFPGLESIFGQFTSYFMFSDSFRGISKKFVGKIIRILQDLAETKYERLEKKIAAEKARIKSKIHKQSTQGRSDHINTFLDDDDEGSFFMDDEDDEEREEDGSKSSGIISYKDEMNFTTNLGKVIKSFKDTMRCENEENNSKQQQQIEYITKACQPLETTILKFIGRIFNNNINHKKKMKDEDDEEEEEDWESEKKIEVAISSTCKDFFLSMMTCLQHICTSSTIHKLLQLIEPSTKNHHRYLNISDDQQGTIFFLDLMRSVFQDDNLKPEDYNVSLDFLNTYCSKNKRALIYDISGKRPRFPTSPAVVRKKVLLVIESVLDVSEIITDHAKLLKKSSSKSSTDEEEEEEEEAGEDLVYLDVFDDMCRDPEYEIRHCHSIMFHKVLRTLKDEGKMGYILETFGGYTFSEEEGNPNDMVPRTSIVSLIHFVKHFPPYENMAILKLLKLYACDPEMNQQQQQKETSILDNDDDDDVEDSYVEEELIEQGINVLAKDRGFENGVGLLEEHLLYLFYHWNDFGGKNKSTTKQKMNDEDEDQDEDDDEEVNKRRKGRKRNPFNFPWRIFHEYEELKFETQKSFFKRYASVLFPLIWSTEDEEFTKHLPIPMKKWRDQLKDFLNFQSLEECAEKYYPTIYSFLLLLAAGDGDRVDADFPLAKTHLRYNLEDVIFHVLVDFTIPDDLLATIKSDLENVSIMPYFDESTAIKSIGYLIKTKMFQMVNSDRFILFSLVLRMHFKAEKCHVHRSRIVSLFSSMFLKDGNLYRFFFGSKESLEKIFTEERNIVMQCMHFMTQMLGYNIHNERFVVTVVALMNDWVVNFPEIFKPVIQEYFLKHLLDKLYIIRKRNPSYDFKRFEDDDDDESIIHTFLVSIGDVLRKQVTYHDHPLIELEELQLVVTQDLEEDRKKVRNLGTEVRALINDPETNMFRLKYILGILQEPLGTTQFSNLNGKYLARFHSLLHQICTSKTKTYSRSIEITAKNCLLCIGLPAIEMNQQKHNEFDVETFDDFFDEIIPGNYETDITDFMFWAQKEKIFPKLVEYLLDPDVEVVRCAISIIRRVYKFYRSDFLSDFMITKKFFSKTTTPKNHHFYNIQSKMDEEYTEISEEYNSSTYYNYEINEASFSQDLWIGTCTLKRKKAYPQAMTSSSKKTSVNQRKIEEEVYSEWVRKVTFSLLQNIKDVVDGVDNRQGGSLNRMRTYERQKKKKKKKKKKENIEEEDEEEEDSDLNILSMFTPLCLLKKEFAELLFPICVYQMSHYVVGSRAVKGSKKEAKKLEIVSDFCEKILRKPMDHPKKATKLILATLHVLSRRWISYRVQVTKKNQFTWSSHNPRYGLAIPYLTAARAAVAVGSPYSAFQIVEFSRETGCILQPLGFRMNRPGEGGHEDEEESIILQDSYQNLLRTHDPDGIYGVHTTYSIRSKLQQWEQEGRWSEVLGTYDSLMRYKKSHPQNPSTNFVNHQQNVDMPENIEEGYLKSLYRSHFQHTINSSIGTAIGENKHQQDQKIRELFFENSWKQLGSNPINELEEEPSFTAQGQTHQSTIKMMGKGGFHENIFDLIQHLVRFSGVRFKRLLNTTLRKNTFQDFDEKDYAQELVRMQMLKDLQTASRYRIMKSKKQNMSSMKDEDEEEEEEEGEGEDDDDEEINRTIPKLQFENIFKQTEKTSQFLDKYSFGDIESVFMLRAILYEKLGLENEYIKYASEISKFCRKEGRINIGFHLTQELAIKYSRLLNSNNNDNPRLMSLYPLWIAQEAKIFWTDERKRNYAIRLLKFYADQLREKETYFKKGQISNKKKNKKGKEETELLKIRKMLHSTYYSLGKWTGSAKSEVSKIVQSYFRTSESYGTSSRGSYTFARYLDSMFMLLQERMAETSEFYDSVITTSLKKLEMTKKIIEQEELSIPKKFRGEKNKGRMVAWLRKNKKWMSAKKQQIRYQLIYENERKKVTEMRTEFQSFLKQTLERYIASLEIGDDQDKYTLYTIFRICSIWFSNFDHPEVIKLFKERILGETPSKDFNNNNNKKKKKKKKKSKSRTQATFPLYHFLTLMYQIASRLGSGEDPALLESLLTKICASHPYHSLVQIVALSNGDIYNVGKEVKGIMDHRKIHSAKSVLDRIRTKTYISPNTNTNSNSTKHAGFDRNFYEALVEEHLLVTKAYIELAFVEPSKLPGWNRKRPKPMKIPKKCQIMNLPSLRTVPSLTQAIPVRRDMNYEGMIQPIVKISSTFDTCGGVNIPKVIYCHDTDGKRYKQLVKGNDDMRQDAVMQQMFGFVNSLLLTKKETRRRNLSIRTYKVVPITPTSGVLEWVVNTMTLSEYLNVSSSDPLGAHGRYRPQDHTPDKVKTEVNRVYVQCLNEVQELERSRRGSQKSGRPKPGGRSSRAARRGGGDDLFKNMIFGEKDDNKNQTTEKIREEKEHDKMIERHWKVRLGVFKKQMQRFKPVFHHFFLEHFQSPISWFTKRLAYTRSMAVNSMVGYILGLGDRHPSNILMDKSTAEIVQIDLGIAFDQGKLLRVPERVPFRLTQDVVDGLGICGVEGAFRRCCVASMNVLRESAPLLTTIVEVFIYDPLYKWNIPLDKLMEFQGDLDEQAEQTEPADSASETIPLKMKMKDEDDEEEESMLLNNTAEEEEESGDNKDAQRCIRKFKEKLSGYEDNEYLSVEGQVNMLIHQARDSKLLAMMYPGWQPWL